MSQHIELWFGSQTMCQGMLIERQAAERGRAGPSRFGGEPELRDLLHDPIARALMAADKVDSGDVYALLRKAHDRVAGSDMTR
jgi:hypothetical protein